MDLIVTKGEGECAARVELLDAQARLEGGRVSREGQKDASVINQMNDFVIDGLE